MKLKPTDTHRCGHPVINPIIEQKLYYSKSEGRLKTTIVKSCRRCHNSRQSKIREKRGK